MSRWRIDQGDCLAVMAGTDADSADAIITDPPYDLTAASRGGSARTNDPATPFGRHRLQSRDGGGFMGQAWDATGVAFDSATWAAALRVAKPGAHLVAFGGTRTHHRLMVAIEDAGWEIRDCLMWLHGQGFPKSHNLSGGVGTALKPAWEPIILARKPLAGTVAANVARYGTGALNIDACRLETGGALKWSAPRGMGFSGGHNTPGAVGTRNSVGRWPANVVLDEDAAAALDAAAGERPAGVAVRHRSGGRTFGGAVPKPALPDMTYGDTGGPSRFFYTAKASRSERDSGLHSTCTVKYNLANKEAGLCEATVHLLQRVTSDIPTVKWHIGESGANITARCQRDSLSTTLTAIRRITTSEILGSLTHSLTSASIAAVSYETANGGSPAESAASLSQWLLSITNGQTPLALGAASAASTMLSLTSDEGAWKPDSNFHATVKPLALMRWLVRLVAPPGGLVLDPFAGSGSTGCAAVLEGCRFVGVDQDADYCEVARRRIAHWAGEVGLFAVAD